MQRQSVTSSSLRSVGYDAATETLEVEFTGGGVYEYRSVPEAVYQALLSAPSLGTYFHENIRDRYPYNKLS